KPTLTIVSYGGMADLINTILNDIFVETDLKPELIIPSLISDMPVHLIADSLEESGKLLFVEEGSASGGIGAELAAQIAEYTDFKYVFRRIAALPVPVPSVKSLENLVIPDKNRIIQEIKYYFT
ncbi:MAG: transketolase C-terminal domain-containing protein, partial [Pseudomonadota bacterium]